MSNESLSEGERAAVRAYLGRAEVRLSTLHRIATAFISGAGLLLLIPIFLRDVVEGLLRIFIGLAVQMPFENAILNATLFLVLTYPFILSLAIPLYGMYLMLKDNLQFYFTLYAPGLPTTLINPTFALNALMLSPDEAPNTKEAARQIQYQESYMDYAMSFSDKRRARYFDELAADTKGEIIPPSRRGIVANGLSENDIQRLNTAIGITRGLDRTLIEEVALIELTLVRNILYLRRLILRYVKTLLMFIWTAVISFFVLPFLQDEHYPTLWLLVLVYLTWSIVAILLVRAPLAWIYRHRKGDVHPKHIDVQLTHLDQRVLPFLYFSIFVSGLGIILLMSFL